MPTAGTASAVAGVIAMVLLTLSVVLGVGVSRRPRPRRLPRSALRTAHRDLSLLAAGFLAVHIVTAVGGHFAGPAWPPSSSRSRRVAGGCGWAWAP